MRIAQFFITLCVSPETEAPTNRSRTGSGKTTIQRLLYQLYDCTSGEISIDSQPLKSVTLKLLDGIAEYQPSHIIIHIYSQHGAHMH